MVNDRKFRQEAKSVGASAVGGREGIRVASQVGTNREIAALLDRIAEVRIKREGRISKPTALLVDKSSSETLDLGRRIARLITAALIDRVARLHVFAFDSAAYPLNAASGAGWAESLQSAASGRVDPCAGLDILRTQRLAVEQIVLVIGACKSEMPNLAGAYAAYKSDVGLTPAVTMVNVGGESNSVERELRRAGAPVIANSFNGDRNSLAGLIRLLCRPSKLDLLMGLLESGAASGAH